MLVRIFSLMLLVQLSLLAANYAVVMNKDMSVEKISPKILKDIFLMKRHFINDIKVVPVNSAASLTMRAEFEKNILGMNRNRLNSYWVKQHFSGVRPPVVQASVNSIKLFIKNVQGAIAYIPIKDVDSDLKVLYEF